MWEQLLRAPRASKFTFDGHPWEDWDCLCDYCDAYPDDLDEELDEELDQEAEDAGLWLA